MFNNQENKQHLKKKKKKETQIPWKNSLVIYCINIPEKKYKKFGI